MIDDPKVRFSPMALALLVQDNHVQESLDRMQGQALRKAIDDAGPHGRVVVQRYQDEITFTVERYAK